MDELRIINNLCDQECIRNVAFKGNLICNCQNKLFNIYHSGKKTRGILASYLMKRNKQIIINAVCKKCCNEITIYDSNIDGVDALKTKKYPIEKFILKDENDAFEIIMMYNYYEKDFKTNQFVECFIEIFNDKMKKPKRLFEG